MATASTAITKTQHTAEEPAATAAAATAAPQTVAPEAANAASLQVGLLHPDGEAIATGRGTVGTDVTRPQTTSNVEDNETMNSIPEDQITASDIPAVVANVTRQSILENMGVSVRAQANVAFEQALSLLD